MVDRPTEQFKEGGPDVVFFREELEQFFHLLYIWRGLHSRCLDHPHHSAAPKRDPNQIARLGSALPIFGNPIGKALPPGDGEPNRDKGGG